MKAEDDLVYKVLDVSSLRTSDEHHPVVREAFGRHLLPELSSVAQLQLHLHCTLMGGTDTGELQTKLALDRD